MSYSSATLSGSKPCTNPALQCFDEINSVATLRGRVGCLIRPDGMVYGTASFASNELEFATDNGTLLGVEKRVNRYVVGPGLERAFTPGLNRRVAVDYYDNDHVIGTVCKDIAASYTGF